MVSQLDAHFAVDEEALIPAARKAWVPLVPDAAGYGFAQRCEARRHGYVRGALHSFLRHFMSDFDVNGLLNMYPLHLLSVEQWTRLLSVGEGATLLDVGAGNGDLTAQLAPLFGRVDATEAASAMRRRLRKRGFSVIDLPGQGRYDAVSCLHVLDRTAQPISLLRTLSRLVAPGGQLVVSVPLPLEPFYYEGPYVREPLESLGVTGKTWELATSQLVAVLDELLVGFKLRHLSKAPYLSGGDRSRAMYALEAAILVFERLQA